MGGSVRPPAVAGAFYAASGAELAREIESCFLDPRGPGELPARHRSSARRIRAALVPHAGYRYSGPIAALVYQAIASERPPESVLILGVDHYGKGDPYSLSAMDWATPLGPVAVDGNLVEALHHPPVTIDEAAHASEHSLEVQLPFLDYVLPQPKVACLMVRMGAFSSLERVARVVERAVAGRDVLLLASTDFSHYVPPELARKLDALALDEIVRRSPKGLYDVVVGKDISMCGIAPTTVLLEALRDEPLTARLLRWGHSGEAEPMREVVGYAAALFESGADLPTRP
ncbi:MAG: AmmeMemoRadiSam system protein B [Thermoplasmata archaeon]|nr:AmmeMemoRadiSam system protein B [Thermoplasmata archaeon]